MRSDIASLAVALGLVCSTKAAAPTYSCFDPPDEGQTNPLGEGMEDIVGAECCEALIDESDIFVGRLVIWDPLNCNHGPGPSAITEEPLCRAHDTDGCRFCHLSCENFQGLCIACSETPRFDETASPTSSPTSSPSGFGFGGFFSSGDTPAPFGLFPNTLPPHAFGGGTGGGGGGIGGIGTLDPVGIREEGGEGEIGDVSTLEPVEVAEGGFGEGLTNCGCLENISETEAEVLAVRGKALVCDPTCLDGSDLIWGVMNCNYFALGQECRACADTCEPSEDGIWLDQFDAPCKPCSVIFPEPA